MKKQLIYSLPWPVAIPSEPSLALSSAISGE